jgi:hypothetical protein
MIKLSPEQAAGPCVVLMLKFALLKVSKESEANADSSGA